MAYALLWFTHGFGGCIDSESGDESGCEDDVVGAVLGGVWGLESGQVWYDVLVAGCEWCACWGDMVGREQDMNFHINSRYKIRYVMLV